MSRTHLLLLACAPLTAPSALAQDGSSLMGKGVARAAAARAALPDPAHLAVEDLINAPRHQIPLPKAGEALAMDLRWDHPFARPGRAVLQIGLATPQVHSTKSLPPLHLALVIDRSSSMAEDDKMARVKQGLLRFCDQLRPQDRVALITYADSAAVLRTCEPFGDGAAVRAAIRGLEPGGHTNLNLGLMCGYQELHKVYSAESQHRVILLSDGLANRGITDDEAIAKASAAYNRKGLDLATIGVGQDFNHQLLQRLARAGRGLCHFVADAADIEEIFVQQVLGLLGVVARQTRLELRHGKGLVLEQIYGYQPKRRADGFRIDLENCNYGMTKVVLCRFVRAPGYAPGEADRVHCRLSFVPEGGAGRRHLQDSVRILPAAEASADYAVRKNFCIAVLAQACLEMSRHGKRQCFREAEQAALRALRFYRRDFQRTRDKDLLGMRQLVERYRKVVARHIERYRRL